MSTATANKTDAMTVEQVKDVIRQTQQASKPGIQEDGTRIHVRYEKKPSSTVTDKAKEEAKRAKDLELPLDSYTGRVDKAWYSKQGDLILTMYVELERDHKFRSFNVDKGKIKHIVILGE